MRSAHPAHVVGDVAEVATQFEIVITAAVLQLRAKVGEHVRSGNSTTEFDHLTCQLGTCVRGVGFGREDLDLDLVEVDLEFLEHGDVVVDNPIQNRVEDCRWPWASSSGSAEPDTDGPRRWARRHGER